MEIEVAKREAAKRFHGFVKKNPQHLRRNPLAPEETLAKLKQIEAMYAGAICRKRPGQPRPLFSSKVSPNAVSPREKAVWQWSRSEALDHRARQLG